MSQKKTIYALFPIFACHLFACRTLKNNNELLRDSIPASGNAAVTLGRAYHKAKKKFLPNLCVAGQLDSRGNEIGELRYKKDMTFEEALETVSGSLSVSAQFQLVSAKASARIALSASKSSISETHTFYWNGIRRKKVFTDGSLNLTDFGRKVASIGPMAILDQCGDEFVSEVALGATFFATMRIDFLSEEDRKKYSGALEIGLVGGILNVRGELSHVDGVIIARPEQIEDACDGLVGDVTHRRMPSSCLQKPGNVCGVRSAAVVRDAPRAGACSEPPARDPVSEQ